MVNKTNYIILIHINLICIFNLVEMNPALYKVAWYWNEDTKKLEYSCLFENKRGTKSRTTVFGDPSYTTIGFQENVDLNMKKNFKLNYQRVVLPDVPAVVTLQVRIQGKEKEGLNLYSRV